MFDSIWFEMVIMNQNKLGPIFSMNKNEASSICNMIPQPEVVFVVSLSLILLMALQLALTGTHILFKN